MTAGKLAEALELRYAPTGPCYIPHPGRVVLPPEVLRRSDAISLLIVAHEYSHLRQHQRWPYLFAFRWILPVTWFLEWDANKHALHAIEHLMTIEEFRMCKERVSLWRWTYA